MVNQSKINDQRYWALWRKSGAIGSVASSIERVEKSIDTEILGTSSLSFGSRSRPKEDWQLPPDQLKLGFNAVYSLSKQELYQGNGDRVMCVWWPHQVVPANAYREHNFPNLKVDLLVCEDPNVQFQQVGEKKSVVYHF